jgi:hypothetical protein
MHQNTIIIIRKSRVNGTTPIEINKRFLQGCHLSPMLFNIHINRVIKNGLQMIKIIYQGTLLQTQPYSPTTRWS